MKKKKKKYNFQKVLKKQRFTVKLIEQIAEDDPSFQSRYIDGVKVVGDQDYYVRFCEAFEWLRVRDPFNHRRVCHYLKTIVQENLVNAGSVFVSMGLYHKSLNGNPASAWLASLLVHEAVHCILFERLQKKGVTYNQYFLERACMRVQLRCAVRMGYEFKDCNEYIEKMLSQPWWTFFGKLRKWFRANV